MRRTSRVDVFVVARAMCALRSSRTNGFKRAQRQLGRHQSRRTNRRAGRRDARSTPNETPEADPIGYRGREVAIVGIGTRGCALVDALCESRALPESASWALSADVGSLERSAAANRWRLPPQTVEVSGKVVEDNAASAAAAVMSGEGTLSGTPPRTVVVLCAGGEALESGEAFVREISRVKASTAKRGFFGFKGASRAPEGGMMLAGVIEPFSFEGRRKKTSCEEFVRCASGAGACDVVLTVSQSELLKNGEENMSVQDATSVADASLLFSVLSSLDALRGNCWNSNFVANASDVEAWVPQTKKNELRAFVNRVMSSRGGGCGVSHAGRGVAQVPTYGSIDEACASAARKAILTAARESPFLAPGRFDTAHLVVCMLKHGVSLGPIARAAVSQALSELAPEAEQFITVADPDKKGTTEVEVSLLTVTDAATAANAAPESTNVSTVLDEQRAKVNAMPFIPRYDTENSEPETQRRKTTKLSREDLKTFGFGDTKEMVTQLEATRAGISIESEPVAEKSKGEEPVVYTSAELSGETSSAQTVTDKITYEEVEIATNAPPKVTLPALPRDFAVNGVAVRISEPQRDNAGNVIGYKTLEAKESDSTKQSKKLSRGRSLFGWRPAKKEEEKSNLSKRALGMLEKDRVGSDRSVVRVEFASLAVYEGEWVNGKREGDGRQVFANGDWYDGKWFGDLPNGKGRLSFKTGDVAYFDGTFNAGEVDGDGTLVKHSGEEITGIWRDGALVSDERDLPR